MKKFIYLAMVIAATLFATSCTQEELLDNHGESTVTFTVATPEMGTTRAYGDGILGDGSQIERLVYALYKADGTPLMQETVPFTTKRTTVSMSLVSGQGYKIVFWADADKGHYTFSQEEKSITVNYKDAAANDESRDAFYAVYSIDRVDGAINETVYLKRPFAQINMLTNDYAQASAHGSAVSHTKIKTTSYNTLSLLDGKVSNPVEVTYGYAAIPTITKDVNGKTYHWLAMNYLLVDKKELMDCTFTTSIDGSSDLYTRSFTNVPVERNYRTNIFGSLLTDAANFNVEIVPDFVEENLEAWDGTSLVEPEVDANGVYHITTGAQLAWVAAAVNGTLDDANVTKALEPANNFNGKTIVLDCDIDLNSKEWTPIGHITNGRTFHFVGKFDGQGNTIHNLKVSTPNASHSSGLFGVLMGSVDNLVIENAEITSTFTTGEDSHFSGALAGIIYGQRTYSNIVVKGSKVQGNTKVGGIVGYNEGSLCFDGCKIIDTYVESVNPEDGGSVGGLIGFVNDYATKEGAYGDDKTFDIVNCSVENLTINAYNSTNSGKRGNGVLVGSYYGADGYALNIERCSVQEATINETINGTDAVTYVSPYGELVGGSREEPNKGKVYIDGYEIANDGVGIDAEGNYHIFNVNGMTWLSVVVNGYEPYTPTQFDDKIVYLENDIDMQNAEWIPIGDDRFQRTEFKGVFDGLNHTIKNFKITQKTALDDANKSSYGLFGNVNGTIRNLTVDNVTINNVPKYVGVLVGRFNGGLIENCHVTNSNVSIKDWTIGGLVGQSNGGDIKNCSVSKTTITGYSAVGAISGILCNSGERTIENCVVKDCSIISNGAFGGDYDKMYGTIVGALYNGNAVLYLNNNTVENTTVKGELSEVLCGFSAKGDVVVIDGVSYTTSQEIVLNTEYAMAYTGATPISVSGEGRLILDGTTIAAESGSAVTLAENTKATIEVRNNVTLTGAVGGEAINVPATASLTLTGEGNLVAVGNNKTDDKDNGGSAIGNAGAGVGKITIDNLANITAKGYGKHAFGIGGSNATVVIKKSTIDYACGGFIQPLFVYDTDYGKSEPESGAGIGGADITIEDATITKVDGGSKAAGIGAKFWESTKITIKNSTVGEVNGGNASAGIGGSRYHKEAKQNIDILIENSTITANGGQYGAGIGSGYDTYCNGNVYSARHNIVIRNNSKITAKGGKGGAGIGTGHHSAYLSGSIDSSVTVNATAGEPCGEISGDCNTNPQEIGYGAVDTDREFSGNNANVTFVVGNTVISVPTIK